MLQVTYIVKQGVFVCLLLLLLLFLAGNSTEISSENEVIIYSELEPFWLSESNVRVINCFYLLWTCLECTI